MCLTCGCMLLSCSEGCETGGMFVAMRGFKIKKVGESTLRYRNQKKQ